MSRTEFKFAFNIHPKPDGGFEAVSENPPIKLEGPTREDVERQVRERLGQMLGPEVAAMLPGSFTHQMQQAIANKATFTGGDNKTSVTVKKTFKITSGVNRPDGKFTGFTKTITTGAPQMPSSTPEITSSSSTSEEDFGPIRRPGDGSPSMLMLRILIAGIVILAILFFLRR